MDDCQTSKQADVLMLFSVLSAELLVRGAAVHELRPGATVEFRAGGSEPRGR